MLLNPLTILLLGQLFIILLVVIFYQALQKRRLLKELSAKTQQRTKTKVLAGSDFNRQEVTQLLNSLATSLKPATPKQNEIFAGLAAALSLQLIPLSLVGKDEFSLGMDSDDLISQQDIDSAIGNRISTSDPLDMLDESLDDLGLNLDKNLDGNLDLDLEGLEDASELEDFDLDAIDLEADELDAADSDEDIDLGVAELELESLDLEADDDLSAEDFDLDFDKELDFSDMDFDKSDNEQVDSLPEDDLQAAIDAAAEKGFDDLEKALS